MLSSSPPGSKKSRIKTIAVMAVAGAAFYMIARNKYHKTIAPIAQQRKHEVVFGAVPGEDRGPDAFSPQIKLSDPWFWLRDFTRKDTNVLAHLKRENAYTNLKTEHLVGFRKVLYDEHISHLKETDDQPAYIYGDYFYYSRTEKGRGYKIYCRVLRTNKEARLPDPEEKEDVYLDVNEVAKGHAECTLGGITVSPEHKFVAYSVDFSGKETYDIKIRNVATGKDISDVILKTSGTMQWGADSKTLYYFEQDESHRPYKFMRHTIGTPQSDDVLLMTEKDAKFWMWLSKSKSRRFLFLWCASSETTEISYLDLTSKESKLVLIQPRIFGLRYNVEHNGYDSFLILTNKDKALNNRLMLTSISDTRKEKWTELMEYDSSRKFDDLDVFKDFIVLEGRLNGLSQIWVIDAPQGNVNSDSFRCLKFKEELYDVDLSINKVFDTSYLRITYSSLTTPTTWYDIELSNKSQKEWVMIKETEILNFDKKKYACKRLHAKASDGTLIPMSMVCLKSCLTDGLKPATPKPMMLYGYGSYGISIDPSFRRLILPYLDRGVIFIIAHIRGSGTMGQFWYEEQGKYLNKRNTFSDFISCAEHLIDSAWTSKDLMAIMGRSAGGLLVGNVVNMRPDLFKVAVADVPFVDFLNTMCDPSVPLTTGEWEEWGNPNTHKYFDYMMSYSPYDNVRKQTYPHMFVSAGLYDPRVGYWEAAKWVSKMRFNKIDQNDIVFKIDMDSGHFSASDRYKLYRERAYEQAFVFDKLGVFADEIRSASINKSQL